MTEAEARRPSGLGRPLQAQAACRPRGSVTGEVLARTFRAGAGGFAQRRGELYARAGTRGERMKDEVKTDSRQPPLRSSSKRRLTAISTCFMKDERLAAFTSSFILPTRFY